MAKRAVQTKATKKAVRKTPAKTEKASVAKVEAHPEPVAHVQPAVVAAPKKQRKTAAKKAVKAVKPKKAAVQKKAAAKPKKTTVRRKKAAAKPKAQKPKAKKVAAKKTKSAKKH